MEQLDKNHNDFNSDEDISEFIDMLPAHLNLRNVLHNLERYLVIRALRVARGVQAEAARMLGISRSDMAYKVKKFDLEI